MFTKKEMKTQNKKNSKCQIIELSLILMALLGQSKSSLTLTQYTTINQSLHKRVYQVPYLDLPFAVSKPGVTFDGLIQVALLQDFCQQPDSNIKFTEASQQMVLVLDLDRNMNCSFKQIVKNALHYYDASMILMVSSRPSDYEVLTRNALQSDIKIKVILLQKEIQVPYKDNLINKDQEKTQNIDLTTGISQTIKLWDLFQSFRGLYINGQKKIVTVKYIQQQRKVQKIEFMFSALDKAFISTLVGMKKGMLALNDDNETNIYWMLFSQKCEGCSSPNDQNDSGLLRNCYRKDVTLCDFSVKAEYVYDLTGEEVIVVAKILTKLQKQRGLEKFFNALDDTVKKCYPVIYDQKIYQKYLKKLKENQKTDAQLNDVQASFSNEEIDILSQTNSFPFAYCVQEEVYSVHKVSFLDMSFKFMESKVDVLNRLMRANGESMSQYGIHHHPAWALNGIKQESTQLQNEGKIMNKICTSYDQIPEFCVFYKGVYVFSQEIYDKKQASNYSRYKTYYIIAIVILILIFVVFCLIMGCVFQESIKAVKDKAFISRQVYKSFQQGDQQNQGEFQEERLSKKNSPRKSENQNRKKMSERSDLSYDKVEVNYMEDQGMNSMSIEREDPYNNMKMQIPQQEEGHELTNINDIISNDNSQFKTDQMLNNQLN